MPLTNEVLCTILYYDSIYIEELKYYIYRIEQMNNHATMILCRYLIFIFIGNRLIIMLIAMRSLIQAFAQILISKTQKTQEKKNAKT